MTIVVGALVGTANPSPHAVGDHWEIYCKLTYSSTYATNGDTTVGPKLETLFKQVGTGILDWVEVGGVPGYMFVFNYATNKLQLYWTGAATVAEEHTPAAAFAEFTNGAEYPAAIRTGPVRLFAVGR